MTTFKKQQILAMIRQCGLPLSPADLTVRKSRALGYISVTITGTSVSPWLRHSPERPSGFVVWSRSGHDEIHALLPA